MQTYGSDLLAEKDYISTLRGVWQSVILQAILDATTLSAKPSMQKARTEALAWFCMENDDFLEVCSFANMNPHRVMKGAMREIKRSQAKHKHIVLMKQKKAQRRKKNDNGYMSPEKKQAEEVFFIS